VLEHYPNDVKLVSKEFPLAMHKQAKAAAIAALAAGEQGKYWEYHDKLLDNYNKLSGAKFLEIAEELGLDMDAFKKSLTDSKHQRAIAKDMKDGSKAGVTGTPTIFVAGRRLQNRSLDGFKAIIDAELKKKK
jgi:protein-disulfide isomerase